MSPWCVSVCVLLSFCMSSVFLLSRVLFCNFALSLHRLDTPLLFAAPPASPGRQGLGGLETLPTVCCWYSLILKDPLSNFSLVFFNLLMSLPSHNRSMPNENVFTQRPKDTCNYMVCTCALRYVYGNPFGP